MSHFLFLVQEWNGWVEKFKGYVLDTKSEPFKGKSKVVGQWAPTVLHMFYELGSCSEFLSNSDDCQSQYYLERQKKFSVYLAVVDETLAIPQFQIVPIQVTVVSWMGSNDVFKSGPQSIHIGKDKHKSAFINFH